MTHGISRMLTLSAEVSVSRLPRPRYMIQYSVKAPEIFYWMMCNVSGQSLPSLIVLTIIGAVIGALGMQALDVYLQVKYNKKDIKSIIEEVIEAFVITKKEVKKVNSNEINTNNNRLLLW